MRKNLALAVLWALVSLGGSLEPDASPFDADGDTDDAGIECLELRRDATAGCRVLEAASHASGESIDTAWVARDSTAADGPSAAVAVQQSAAHLALVNLSVDAGSEPMIAATLLARALDHCRDSGALKVIIESQGIAPNLVQTLAESCGCQFSRSLTATGQQSLEFYIDLYWRPSARHA